MKGSIMEDFNVSACSNDVYYFVYKTTNLINENIYVGKHIQIGTSAFDGYLGSGLKISRSVKKYGRENFTREIIEFCTSANYNEREIYWIAELSATNPLIGYNISKGGDGAGIMAETTKIKLSKLNKGRILSEETKKKISQGNKGKKQSEEAKQKISEANKGKPSKRKGIPHTKETKIKMSNAQKGNKHSVGNHGFLGKHHSKEAKRKIGEASKKESLC
jgi:hypothetical protein